MKKKSERRPGSIYGGGEGCVGGGGSDENDDIGPTDDDPTATVKPVCNDHLYDKNYYLWFTQ